jgi:hypothetical protein
MLLLFWISLTFAAGCARSDRLVLESPGQLERFIELKKIRTFSLRYVHSVEKTPVIETFQVLDDGNLMLTSTAYQSYGVGLPSLPEEGTLTISDGWLILKNLQRLYPDIRLRVGPEAGVSLEVENRTYPIYQWYPAGSLVIIRKDSGK